MSMMTCLICWLIYLHVMCMLNMLICVVTYMYIFIVIEEMIVDDVLEA